MNYITIHDSNQKLKFACDDLSAIRSIILTVGDHDEYANAYEALKVIDRALDAIITDIEASIESIDSVLQKKVQDDQQN